jgi:hypothetical protein
MSDIFTSKIDESSSGPIPAKDDVRPQDILSDIEQREIRGDFSEFKKETQQGIRDSTLVTPDQFSLVQPPIPPPVPLFGTTQIFPQLSYDAVSEIGRQSALDVIKNITINGQSASINGSNISFEVQQEPRASEIFAAQNAPTTPAPSFVFQPPVSQQPNQDFSQIEPSLGPLPSSSLIQQQDPLTSNSIKLNEVSKNEIEDKTSRIKNDFEVAAVESSDKNQETENNKNKTLDKSIVSNTEYSFRYNEKASEKKSDREKNQSTQDADTTYAHGSSFPVLFQRADGQRKIIALLDDKYGGVVEGPNPTAFLPSTDSYYIATGEIIDHPWKIELRTNPNTQNYEIRVSSESRLFSGLGDWSTVEISGLGSWVNLSYGYVVLSCGVSGSNPTSGSVNFFKSSELMFFTLRSSINLSNISSEALVITIS